MRALLRDSLPPSATDPTRLGEPLPDRIRVGLRRVWSRAAGIGDAGCTCRRRCASGQGIICLSRRFPGWVAVPLALATIPRVLVASTPTALTPGVDATRFAMCRMLLSRTPLRYAYSFRRRRVRLFHRRDPRTHRDRCCCVSRIWVTTADVSSRFISRAVGDTHMNNHPGVQPDHPITVSPPVPVPVGGISVGHAVCSGGGRVGYGG